MKCLRKYSSNSINSLNDQRTLVLCTVRKFRDRTGLKMLKKDRSRTEPIATFNFRPDRTENLK
jgi:hypothetical protein